MFLGAEAIPMFLHGSLLPGVSSRLTVNADDQEQDGKEEQGFQLNKSYAAQRLDADNYLNDIA